MPLRRCCALLVFAAQAFAPICAGGQEPAPPTFRAESKLVLIEFSVVQNRQAILDLVRDDVTILEDGKEQPITVFENPDSRTFSIPVEATFLLDVSGTVVYGGLFDARTIYSAFVEGARKGARVSVYSFAKKHRRHCLPTRDTSVLETALAEAKRQPHDGTSLYTSVAAVCDELGEMGQAARRALFVISDGRPYGGDRATPDEAADAARKAGIRVFPVILSSPARGGMGNPNPNADRGVDMELAQFAWLGRETGGRSFEVAALPDSKAFSRILTSVVEQINVEYTAGYYARTNAGKPKRRSVTVRVRDRSRGTVYGGVRTVVH